MAAFGVEGDVEGGCVAPFFSVVVVVAAGYGVGEALAEVVAG